MPEPELDETTCRDILEQVSGNAENETPSSGARRPPYWIIGRFFFGRQLEAQSVNSFVSCLQGRLTESHELPAQPLLDPAVADCPPGCRSFPTSHLARRTG